MQHSSGPFPFVSSLIVRGPAKWAFVETKIKELLAKCEPILAA
jgi:hypothetical protein